MGFINNKGNYAKISRFDIQDNNKLYVELDIYKSYQSRQSGIQDEFEQIRKNTHIIDMNITQIIPDNTNETCYSIIKRHIYSELKSQIPNVYGENGEWKDYI